MKSLDILFLDIQFFMLKILKIKNYYVVFYNKIVVYKLKGGKQMMEDDKIIELFFLRSERAIYELNKKYGRICYKISYNILNNIEDTEECINESYFGIWNKIPPEKPNPLIAYICKVVRNISLKLYYKKCAIKRNNKYNSSFDEIGDIFPSKETVETEFQAKEAVEIIEEFLEKLSKENRIIFLRRYWFLDSYADISKYIGLSEKNISVRLTRMRKQIKKHFLKRGVII